MSRDISQVVYLLPFLY